MQNYIEGFHSIEEAIKEKVEIQKVFIRKETTNERVTNLVKILHKENIHFSYVPKERIQKLTKKS